RKLSSRFTDLRLPAIRSSRASVQEAPVGMPGGASIGARIPVTRARSLTEDAVGVRPVSSGLGALLRWIRPTFEYAPGARPALDIGYFANVVPVAPNLGIAISTDGVGTKLLIAQAAERYDTVGVDCVAMNVNDVLCVGARPIALVDYIAVEEADADL